MERADLLEQLAARIDAVRSPPPVKVAVDGPDAAGKTTLADELASALRERGRQVVRACADDFARPRAQRYARGPTSPEGYYRDSFDEEALLTSLLDPLGPAGSRQLIVGSFELRTDRPWTPDPVAVAEDAILFCDGLFLLRPELRDRWDLSIHVTAAFDVRLARARVRDLDRFGRPDEVERRYRERYEPGQDLYRSEARPEQTADVVVHNDDPRRPRAVFA